MPTEAILKPIGKGQYTFPKKWRTSLGINNKNAKAFFLGDKIIITPLDEQKVTWDVSTIELSHLSDETVKDIEMGEKNYNNKNSSAFMTSDEFWNETFDI